MIETHEITQNLYEAIQELKGNDFSYEEYSIFHMKDNKVHIMIRNQSIIVDKNTGQIMSSSYKMNEEIKDLNYLADSIYSYLIPFVGKNILSELITNQIFKPNTKTAAYSFIELSCILSINGNITISDPYDIYNINVMNFDTDEYSFNTLKRIYESIVNLYHKINLHLMKNLSDKESIRYNILKMLESMVKDNKYTVPYVYGFEFVKFTDNFYKFNFHNFISENDVKAIVLDKNTMYSQIHFYTILEKYISLLSKGESSDKPLIELMSKLIGMTLGFTGDSYDTVVYINEDISIGVLDNNIIFKIRNDIADPYTLSETDVYIVNKAIDEYIGLNKIDDIEEDYEEED